MTRRAFWRTFHSISDPETQLDYLYMVKPEIDAANDLLGLPRVTPIDVPRTPAEWLSDPLFGHTEIMSSLYQQRLLEDESGLDPDEQVRISEMLSRYGSDDEAFGALSPAQANDYIAAMNLPE